MHQRTPSLALLVAAVALSTALAGCLGDETSQPTTDDPPPEASLQSADGRDLRYELNANDTLDVPVWRVGDWFGHHVFFGPDDDTGQHYNTIVTEVTAQGYHLAPDTREAARDHALVDIPLLGFISHEDLSMTGLGTDWRFYDWPLADGKEWTGSFHVPEDSGLEPAELAVHFKAQYAPEIMTPDGPRPGFVIAGVLDDGTPFLDFDYVPALGWYAHFFLWDFSTPEPDDYIFHVTSMGHGAGWTGGVYIVDHVDQVLEHVHVTVAVPPPQAQGAPVGDFTVSDEATYLWGIVFNGAVGGVHATELIDPDGNRIGWESMGVNPADDDSTQVEFWQDGATPGQWRIVTAGAGVATWGGAVLWEFGERVMELK